MTFGLQFLNLSESYYRLCLNSFYLTAIALSINALPGSEATRLAMVLSCQKLNIVYPLTINIHTHFIIIYGSLFYLLG
jgi:hypothetical protein